MKTMIKQSLNSIRWTSVLLFLSLTLFSSCLSDDEGGVTLADLSLQVTGTEHLEGLEVRLTNTGTATTFTATTDADGIATFRVAPGIYEAVVSVVHYNDGQQFIYNGVTSNIVLNSRQTNVAALEVKESRSSQVIIKELYCGGCLRDNGSTFQYDKCIILYNNSAGRAELTNLCIGMVGPYNGHSNNNNYTVEGKLTYELENFLPAIHGIWWFQQPLVIEPYSQVVVNICGAVDNTQTVSMSVNYAHSDYYAMYDPSSGYYNTSYYPTPSSVIPTDHYLKARELGIGNGWTFSVTSPAVFLFQTHDISPEDFSADVNNLWYDGGRTGQVYACLKVPNDWVLDGFEVYQKTKVAESKKRMPSTIDAGYVTMTNYLGHALYRNVDEAATKALPENEGKLVYGYALGVDDSTDPSGIDAEASIRNGAHIIFKDTNNSTVDFHERQQCSLRDE